MLTYLEVPLTITLAPLSTYLQVETTLALPLVKDNATTGIRYCKQGILPSVIIKAFEPFTPCRITPLKLSLIGLEQLTKMELAVCEQAPYKAISFFHHVCLEHTNKTSDQAPLKKG